MVACSRPATVLPPVVVDLEPNVGRAQLELVVDACNEVITEAECLPRGAELEQAPRAVAVVRPRGPHGASVRIEVRLLDSGRSLVRSLRFTRSDPERERWRSVGLAIATLVGEARRLEGEESESAEAEPPPPPLPEPEPEPEPPQQPRREPRPEPEAAPEPAPGVEVVEEDDEEPGARDAAAAEDARARRAPRGVFIGVGVLVGPALDDGSWRGGGSVRGGWATDAGWVLLGEASYAARAFEADAYTASWLALSLGAGRHFALADALGLTLSAQLGVQRLELEAALAGERQATSAYNPRLTLGGELWWVPGNKLGVWGAVQAHTIFRRSDLVVAGARTVSTWPVDVSGALGLGWWID